MLSFYNLIDAVLSFYTGCVIAWVIMSWLVVFDVINPRQTFVRMLGQFLSAIVEPVLSQIRRIVPLIGGVDLSPLVLFFIIYFVRSLLREYWFRLFG